MYVSIYFVGERRLMVPKGCKNLNKRKEFYVKAHVCCNNSLICRHEHI